EHRDGPSPTAEPEPAVCDDPAVAHALTDGDDAEVVSAVGGGDAFREAVVGGDAPCLDLTEAGRMWVVVNKRNALDPIDHWPTPQAQPTGIRIVSGGGWLRADVAAALDELAAEIVADGAGRLAVDSAFRPYSFQVDLYKGYVASRGQAAADLRSARPGHSEHQTGLAVDVVACGASGCGSHDGFRGTSQAAWLVDNAWRFGFVVRYEEGRTETTGYAWEPWHLRFIGTELAAAYQAGGFHTLEDFFSLPPAPTYAD
ncbi:MAG: D-alanyl-D-alanine carboxypeptidase family protein, partial [Microbacterium sp.]